MNKVITATEARKNFFKVIEFAGQPGASITVTLEGKNPVVIMSQEEFEGWQETMEILSDPELMQNIHTAESEKETIPLEDIMKKCSKAE